MDSGKIYFVELHSSVGYSVSVAVDHLVSIEKDLKNGGNGSIIRLSNGEIVKVRESVEAVLGLRCFRWLSVFH